MRVGTLATAMGLGGALVYMLDPEHGEQRRAMVRDKLQSLQDRTAGTGSGIGSQGTGTMTGGDMRDRVSEVAGRARDFMQQKAPSSEALMGRARSALGAYPGAQRLLDATTSPAARPIATAAGALLATMALRRTALGRVLGVTGATMLVNTFMNREAYGRR
jgi:hypothetical protein